MQKEAITTSEQNSESELSWKIRSVIPLALAFKIVTSNKPREVLAARNDGKWLASSIFVAVTFTVIVFLGQMGTPWNYPFFLFYGYLSPFIEPQYDLPVLGVAAAVPIVLSIVAYFVCQCTGMGAVRQLKTRNIKEEKRVAIYIAFACIISCTFVSICAAIAVMFVGWLGKNYFGLYIHASKITFFAMVLLAIGLMWFIPNLFKRAAVQFEDKWTAYLYSFFLTSTVMFPCLAGSLTISGYFESALLARGHEKNLAYNRPIASSILNCERVSPNLVCVIALYPEKWQNFELVGKWKFGRNTPNQSVIMSSQWQPKAVDGKTFPTVVLEQKKYITTEIFSSEKEICRAKKTPIGVDDSLFFVMGRITDEHRTSARNFKIHVERGERSFAEMVAAACKT